MRARRLHIQDFLPQPEEGHCKLTDGSLKVPLPDKFHRLDRVDESVEQHIQSCVTGASPWPLLLYGEPGSGKTCAALTVHDYAGGWFITVEDLCDEVRAAMTGEAVWESGYPKTVKEIWTAWSEANLCTLDELATRTKVSDHHYSTLKRAIDLREGKPLIAISNHGLDEIKDIYDARIASRLCCGTIVPMDGDRRLARNLGTSTAKQQTANA